MGADNPDKSWRLDLSYDGTGTHGWQSQPSGLGIQDILQKHLQTVLRHKVALTGASRTDAGVHARQQVAVFRSPVAIEALPLQRSLHGLLPETIAVHGIDQVGESFHPILSARAKIYRYLIWNDPVRNPFLRPFVWHFRGHLDRERIRRELQAIVGEHDFSAFCAVDSSARTRVRHIHDVRLVEAGPLLEIWISGGGFLKQMVRSIVGTLVDLGRGRPMSAPDMEAILKTRDRQKAGVTAPAAGLCLMGLFYDELPDLGSWIKDCAWQQRGLPGGTVPSRAP